MIASCAAESVRKTTMDSAQNGFKWTVGQLQTVHPSEIPHRIKEVQNRLHKSIVRQWRQAITGDPDRRIRDNMDDAHVQTKLKQVDAFSFALGVFLTMLAEWLVLSKPQYFPLFMWTLMPPLFIHRFFSYKQINEQFFMVDFCYFLTLSTWLNTFLCPCEHYADQCQIWFKSNYVLAHGPIAFAIVAWQNSLVFHSIDKVTSFALHIFPGLNYYLLKWDHRMMDHGLAVPIDNLTWEEQFLYPMTFYLTWQMFYFYLQYTVIEKDKSLVTSLRYLVGDHKNPSTKLGYKWAVKLGFVKQGEALNPYKLEIILMFALFQFVYMSVCLIPTFLMFKYELINAMYLIFVTAVAVLNGGSYYIQIFSQRYNTKFLAKAAAVAAASEETNTNLTDKSTDKSD